MIYIIEDFHSIPIEDALSFFSLSPEEEKRIFTKKRKFQSLYARYAAAFGIEKQFGIKKEKIIFSCDELGKPTLKEEHAYFSLTHTKNTVAAGISSCPIGIDIEYIRPLKENIVDKYFSPLEKDHILNSPNKDIAFTEIWCLKESIAKLTGQGLFKVVSTTNIEKQGERFISQSFGCNLKIFYHGNLIIGCAQMENIPKNYIYFI